MSASKTQTYSPGGVRLAYLPRMAPEAIPDTVNNQGLRDFLAVAVEYLLAEFDGSNRQEIVFSVGTQS